MYLVGVDIGGTFTDCVVIDANGAVTTAKSPSTPGDFAAGLINSLELAAERLGHSLEDFLQNISTLSHGTTVGTNAIVQKRGAKVGLITTKGHQDVIHIMRGSRGLQHRDVQEIVHFPGSSKPQPIIPKRLIYGVSERVDCFGNAIVPLNEDEVVSSIKRLVDEGVDAIAVCFLWSFANPSHELRVKELIAEIAPDMFVSCSVDLAPRWGEYERTTAVVLNAYIGPLTSGYLHSLDTRLRSLGFTNPLQITQCGGGTISIEKAMQSPLLTLDSGPVAGVVGSQFLSKAMNHSNVITTDMGGTSFDVGLIREGVPLYSSVSSVNQYEYFIPKVDILAIGAGGGSLVSVDELSRSIRVGPQSAGATPGPICYGRGGTVPTVTDAALVLGYLDPDNFAGGRMKLDKDSATAAIQSIADGQGLSLFECASGIAKIAEFGMADIIRRTTVGKGYDPRDFVLFAFGGAGPVHAGVFARELGVKKVIIPQRETASTWCAFGAASADILHINEQVDMMTGPFSSCAFEKKIAALAKIAREEMAADMVAENEQHLSFSVDMRHKGQINEVEVSLDWNISEGDFDAELSGRFFERYESIYGHGSSFRGARLEAVTFRVRATAAKGRPKLRASGAQTDGKQCQIPETRGIYWDELGEVVESNIYDGTALLAGEVVKGPAVVETPDTSVVVRPRQALTLDSFGNFELNFEEEVAASQAELEKAR